MGNRDVISFQYMHHQNIHPNTSQNIQRITNKTKNPASTLDSPKNTDNFTWFSLFFFLFHCDLMRSRLSETVLILGRSSGSSSVQLRATWNADKTCFLAYTSCNSAGSMISDNGRSSRKTFLTRLSNPLPSFSGPASGSRAVRTSIRTMPKE